jgi:hypothetical protein
VANARPSTISKIEISTAVSGARLPWADRVRIGVNAIRNTKNVE